VRRYGRQDLPQLAAIDELFMVEADRPDLRCGLAQHFEVLLAFGHLDLSVAFEAAGIVNELLDVVPQLHRRDRQRHFGEMPAQPTHAAGIDSRGVARDMVFFDHDHAASRHCKMQRRRTAVEAPANHYHVGASDHMRTTAFTAMSVWGSAASSATVIGLTGGRRR
jgi:hypothetical protein